VANRWNAQEDALVRQLYPNLNSLVSRLNRRTASAVYARAQTLGLVGSAARKTGKQVAENRALLCKAFKLVRYDPQEKIAATALLDAIAGRAVVTDATVELARKTIASSANASSE
jgi:hypothetical protein